MHWEKELHFARSVAMHAGELAIGYQGKVQPEAKLDLSPVTQADKEGEKLIAARIAEMFPDDGILGEEGANRESRNGRKWILDPIDGTRDFVRGLPLWSVLIGLEVHGEVVLGVSNMAASRAMYWAVKGEGAYCNDERIRISEKTSPSESLVCVNAFNNLGDYPWRDRLLPWLSQFWAVRSMGGCMDAMLVASGRADLWIEAHAQPWDLIALKVILEEAGARFFNFDGGNSIYGGNCLTCVPALEPYARELLGLPAANG